MLCDADGGPQVGHPRGVAAVGHRKGYGILQPVVPYAVGVVRCHREGVLLGAKLAAEGY